MEKNSTHYHFIVWAADRIEEITGNYIGNVIVDVISSTAEEALGRARFLAPKKNIYVSREVIEHLDNQPCR